MTPETGASEDTRREDEREAYAAHQADRPATAEEAELADAAVEAQTPEERERVGDHYKEMADRGVKQKGEGRLD